jgi:competence protein ComEC
VWTVPALPTWVAACGIGAAFVLALPGRWHWRVLALPFLLPFFCLPDAWHLLPRPAPGQFSVVVLDVGQGGATLVRTSSRTLLFDAGPLRPDGSDLVERVLAPMLQSLGVQRLDALVISHDDADHRGGAQSLLDGIEVGQLMTPFDADHPLLQQPVAHRACEAGGTWTWDGVVFRVLHPGPRVAKEADNARSCVLQVEAAPARGQAPVRLLLTADIEAAQEQALLARWPEATLRSTVMLVPHHGSRTSSTPEWLRVVAPRQAVVQVGERNTYGHPSPVVMQRYAQAGIPVVTTPACGAFVWESTEAVRAERHASQGQPVVGHCWQAKRTRHWQR